RHGGTCSSDEEDQLRLDLMRQVRPRCGFNHAEDFRPTASASSSMLPASKITSLPSPRSAQPAHACPAHPSPCGKPAWCSRSAGAGVWLELRRGGRAGAGVLCRSDCRIWEKVGLGFQKEEPRRSGAKNTLRKEGLWSSAAVEFRARGLVPQRKAPLDARS